MVYSIKAGPEWLRLRAAAVALLAVLALMSAACATSRSAEGPSGTGSPETQEGRPAANEAECQPVSPEEWGIKVLSIRQTAAGRLLDLRYEIIDQQRATVLLKGTVRPYIVHERTGLKLGVPSIPKLGRLQQTKNPQVPGKVYFMMFDNLGGLVRPGDSVKLVIEDVSFNGLTVQ